MMTALKLIPNWTYGLLLAVALIAGIAWYSHVKGEDTGRAEVQALWDADKVARDKAAQAAVAKRDAQNAAQVAQTAKDNAAITKAHDEENARTVAALTVRLRRGTGICANPGPAATPDPKGTSGGDGASTGTGLFRDDIQRDFVAAIKSAEDAASTARACQAFVRDNGMAP